MDDIIDDDITSEAVDMETDDETIDVERTSITDVVSTKDELSITCEVEGSGADVTETKGEDREGVDSEGDCGELDGSRANDVMIDGETDEVEDKTISRLVDSLVSKLDVSKTEDDSTETRVEEEDGTTGEGVELTTSAVVDCRSEVADKRMDEGEGITDELSEDDRVGVVGILVVI
jgi:hypothetical protein